MPGPILREVKQFTAQIVSGATTSNAWNMAGYSLAGLFVPVIASGYLAFNVAPSGSPSAGNITASDGPYLPVYDKSSNIVSAATPGGTGGVALAADALAPLAGFSGPMRISAATAQTANAVFWVHLKG